MPKSKKEDATETDDAIMERMNEALKKMMATPHETQKEMVKRRRKLVHKSDCAVHDAPAYAPGACTCGADRRAKARR